MKFTLKNVTLILIFVLSVSVLVAGCTDNPDAQDNT